MKYVIWDLDNCLSDDSWRIHLIDWSQASPAKRYARYHSACGGDAPSNVGIFKSTTKDLVPIFMTGRPGSVHMATLCWIRANLGVEDPILIMRNEGDERPSVLVKEGMLSELYFHQIELEQIELAYDDRQDIVDMYRAKGLNAQKLCIHDTCAYTKPKQTAADILAGMANTYRERNAVYGDNYLRVAKTMAALFPQGVPAELVMKDHFHLFELLVVKLTRYAVSNLTHVDSIHDAAIYAAMCESINLGENE